jgi:hypothetical protein
MDSLFPKFDRVLTHTRFVANGTLYSKTGTYTFLEVQNEVLGEQTISKFIEDRIVEDPARVAAAETSTVGLAGLEPETHGKTLKVHLSE